MAPSITGNSVSLNSLLCCNHLSSLINQGPEHTHILGPVFFLRASLVAELVKNPPAMQETLVRFLGWEDPLENGGPPPPVFLGFPSGSDVNNLPAMWETGVDPWVGKIPWRRA